METKENCIPGDSGSDRRSGGSGPPSVKCATGQATVGNQASHAKWMTGKKGKFQLRKSLDIATWNVQGLLQTGKLHITEKELVKQNIDICGIAETHWKGEGHFQTEDHAIYISGAEQTGRNGVAIAIRKSLIKYVYEYHPVNDRLIVLTLETAPTRLHIVQVYMPTTEASDEEIDRTYSEIEKAISKIPGKEPIIIMGDFNAKIGKTTDHDSSIGKFGLGERNSRGERLADFAVENNMAIANTLFEHHPRRLSTWTSPDGNTKNQIDYIIIKNRWRTSIRNAKTKPSADCGSDHRLLWAKFKIKLKTQVKRKPYTRIAITDPDKFRIALEEYPTPELIGHPEKIWKDVKRWIQDAINQCTKLDYQRKKHWMSDSTFDLVERRRALRHNTDNVEKRNQIAQINREIRISSRHDKNEHLHNVCKELEIHANRHESHELFDKVRYLSREFKPRTQAIKNHQGKLITNLEGITEVWKTYCQNLYDDNFTPLESSIHTQEPAILSEEVEKAIRSLKQRKSPGEDEITAEVIKSMGETGVKVIHQLCNVIWTTKEWPTDWRSSIFIPIFKKGSPLECQNYRTVSLISHTSKILLHIIHERLKPFLLPQLAEEQAGFVPGKGTREQILNTRQIVEKAREFNLPTYLCFVDYTKAFDKIKWNLLWKIMEEMGTPQHLISLIRNLYENNTAKVRVDQTYSDKFRTCTGVRQGCILSPILFNIYSEHIMRRVLQEWPGGISIGGKRISNLRYADDTLIITATIEDMEIIMERLRICSEEYGLYLNKKKTKIMIINRAENNSPNIHEIAGYEVVNKFSYLGSLITNKGGCEQEIRRRLTMARTATVKLTKIWKDTSVTKNTKLKIVNCLIFPIATYAAETWTLKKADRKRIEAFELWVYRRILRVSWMEHRTNISILQELKVENRLLQKINHAYLQYFGHIVRRTDKMEKIIVDGIVDGKRPRGRSPTRWIDQLKPLIHKSLHEAEQVAQDRDAWKRLMPQ